VEESTNSPADRFALLVERFLDDPEVTPPSDAFQPTNRFGANGLKVHGKIFAMFVQERLVVKLPRRRVDTLVASGDGERFDPKKNGRLMKEWLVLDQASTVQWLALAREARAFVGSTR
jgi:hypothetical protein